MTDTRSTASTSANSDGTGKARGGKGKKSARKAIKDGAKAVRAQANAAAEAGAQAIDDAPLTALAGAIALGAVAAALLPNTTREFDALKPLGGRVRGALDDAFAAAKAAGTEQLSARGLTTAAASSGITALVGAIVNAAVAANKAADSSIKSASTPDKRAKPRHGS